LLLISYGIEILRLYSRENSAKPKDWYSYLEILVAKLKPKTWDKISDFMHTLNPVLRGCFDQTLSINSIKTLLSNYLRPKLQLEQKVHSERPVSSKNDSEVFESLTKVCRHFDEEEIFETNFSKVMQNYIFLSLAFAIKKFVFFFSWRAIGIWIGRVGPTQN
jgi:hypothetical protein